MGDLVPFPSRPAQQPEERQPLWREAAGGVLRAERLAQQRTLSDVAQRAGVSTQHLSEVERGRKEASSEVLEAVTGALGLRLDELTLRVTRRLTGPVCLAA
ncbi:helix-turn-helix transcriptional regulator [Nocardioides sp.]|jgi:transcriptional regulator with XRE-family HTH domain|uniref:helix-turn-helix domain-containing protein n=1 Tax=Nocardioides sp. TaxID=35761 RepID=UPI002C91548E|nr:helix-turn-helix transcriptional regulator [Nocardioides sp.]HVX54053.1 helix-turn-helix transcriptional regulator [Nocardioides sp.]